MNVNVANTETIGLWTEYVICKVLGLQFNCSRQYIKDLKFDIQQDLETKLEFLKDIGISEHIGNINSDIGDFMLFSGGSISVKSNISLDKVCPHGVGQTSLKKLGLKDNISFKKWVLSDPFSVLKFYSTALMKSEHCIYINYSLGKIFHIRNHLIGDIDNNRITFTKNLENWNESCTMKIDGKSVAEFQVHNNRNVVKCRIMMVSFIRKFTSYTEIDIPITNFKIQKKSIGTFNYIGSKTNLLPFIGKSIETYTGSRLREISSFFDAFSGTGAVSSYLIENGCPIVKTNDNMYCSYILCSGNRNIDVSKYIKEMNNLKPVAGFVHDTYANSRMYFTKENAMIIDAMRTYLENNKYKFGKDVFNVLLRLLLYASSKVANISSTYGAYLKKYKTSSLKKLVIENQNNKRVMIDTVVNYNLPILDLAKSGAIKGEVCYLDPPYNNRKYSSNYFVMECIAKYNKDPVSDGVTGVPLSEPIGSGDFCSKKSALNSFKILFENINTKYIFMSYSSDSLLSKPEIVNLLTSSGWKNLVIYSEDYKKFKSNKKVTDTNVCEYIFCGSKS